MSKLAVYIIKKGARRVDAYLYDLAWRTVRAKRKLAPLEDELLWHKVYDEYVSHQPGDLIERHLGIVGPIAGQIAWKRCPKSFGIWAKEALPSLSHVGLVCELTAFGNLGLFIAADRYDRKSGLAFSTYANYWIKKFVRLYLEEIIGVVPRTGDMGIEGQGEWECGPWVVDKPRRSVLDLLDAALEHRRLYRGKAAGGMAMFDGALTIPGPNRGDKEIETVGTEGQTSRERLDYLQRRVGLKDFPWVDVGTYFVPRLELKGHAGRKASDAPAEEDSFELDNSLEIPAIPVPRKWGFCDIALSAARAAGIVTAQGGGSLLFAYGPSMNQGVIPAEISYLDTRCGSFNSHHNFGAQVHKLAFRHVDNCELSLDAFSFMSLNAISK